MRSHSYRTGWRPAALAAAGCLCLAPTPAYAGGAGSYWAGFKKYWAEVFGNPEGVVLIVLAVGVVSLFIIMRGKWNKSY